VTREGITIAAPGFYAPQGRWGSPRTAGRRTQTRRSKSFGYHGRRITNFEMEGSALRCSLMDTAPRPVSHDVRVADTP